MRKNILLIILIFILFAIQVSASPIESITQHFVYDGVERTYHIHIPQSTTPDHLLIVLHPFGGSGRGMEVITGLDEIADERGFIVVYPNAAGFYWDDGRVQAGRIPDDGIIDDVGFLSALADNLSAEYDIDRERVYLTGMQNGGLIVFRAACQAPDEFAAFIVVGALMWDYTRDNCGSAGSPANLLVINGQEDEWYAEEGRTIDYISTGLSFDSLSRQTVVDFWLARNQCDAGAVQKHSNDNLIVYTKCSNNTTFSYFNVAVSGQNWPRMANNTINRFGVDASQIIAAYMAGDVDWYTLAQQNNIETELARSFILYVPTSYNPDNPTPMVVLLHGRMSNASSQAYASDFKSIAEREGIIALFPEGIETEWNYTRNLPNFINVDLHNDEEFLGSLIDDLSQDLNIDASRVYVTGLSNGGFMTSRLACTEQDRYAAFASVAATAPIGMLFNCEGTGPAPIMYIHGTADSIVPWAGTTYESLDGRPIRISESMEDTVAFWADHNHCEHTLQKQELLQVDPDTTSFVITINGCPPNGEVTLYMVINGGHVWPGIRPDEYAFLGQVSMDFNASEVIWQFFQRHTLNNS